VNNLPQDRKVRKVNRRPVFTATWIAVAFLTATVIAGAPATNADSRGPNGPKELSIFFICNGNVYFGGNDGNLYAVDAKNGEVIWKTTGRGKLTSSPGVAYGVGFMEGTWEFDVKTGKKIWATRKNMLSGCAKVQVCSMNDVLSDEDIAALFKWFFGRE